MVQIVKQAIRALPGYPRLVLSIWPFKFIEFDELSKMVPLRRDDRVLDLGCGPGAQTLLVAQRCGQVVGLDPDPDAIAAAASKASQRRTRNIEFVCNTIENAGLADGSFDKVVSFSVVEHIPNYLQVISEVFRVLKPGGHFVFSTDCLAGVPEDLREKHRKDHHVQAYFSIDGLKRLLLDAGFRNVVVRPLFTTEYARDAFIDGIQKRFLFGWADAWTMLIRLKRQQACTGPHAMFLTASARKPSAN
jgi:SAM-dependent methyltransferase